MSISFKQALTKIHKEAQQIAVLHAFPKKTVVTLEKALGRTTFGEFLSPEDLPMAPTSAMDGFAVRAAQTKQATTQNPILIPILGSIAAGDVPVATDPLAFGAWEIMTGATFPEGFDACIRLEDVEVLSSQKQIKIRAPAQAKQNCRQPGEDFKKEAVLFKQGHCLKSEDILPLAALGINEIPVFARPRVAVISTGKELVSHHEKPQLGQIRNSTAPYLLAALGAFGADVEHIATVSDDPESFKKVLKQNSERYDVILTTGAISVGKHDFVAQALEDLGAEIFFKKVEVRPGKPILFARLKDGPPVFCLPGNPLASAVGLRFFVLPFLRTILFQEPEVPLRARLTTSAKSSKEAVTFVKGKLHKTETSLEIKLRAEQRASLLSPLLASDVWVVLPPSAEGEQKAGSEVDFYLF
jgi:molybdopterin molybdotransferase